MTVQISILSNGLRVVTDTMAESESVVLGVWVGVGTRHEPARANGVAHLVEHMMFKGTKKRSAFDISSAIEQNGGSMNAHTSREETAYYAHVLPDDMALATDILSDMLLHSVFAQKELEKERLVVIQEIGRDKDTPEDHIFEEFYNTAFAGQALGRPILGSADVIAKMPREALFNYVKRYYHAGNMVVVAAGKVEHDAFVKLASRAFGKIPEGKRIVAEKARAKGGECRLTQEIEQTHLVLAFEAPGLFSKNVYAASLLGVVLGGSSASRLFQKVREERGLVYTISASLMPLHDTGLFGVYAGTDPKRVRELMPVVCKELKAVSRRITTVELDRAKAQMRADCLMGQESVMRRADRLGHQMILYGRPIPIQETVNKYLAVSVQDAQAIASTIISRKPILAGLGPLEQLDSYDKIVRYLT